MERVGMHWGQMRSNCVPGRARAKQAAASRLENIKAQKVPWNAEGTEAVDLGIALSSPGCRVLAGLLPSSGPDTFGTQHLI